MAYFVDLTRDDVADLNAVEIWSESLASLVEPDHIDREWRTPYEQHNNSYFRCTSWNALRHRTNAIWH
jgi:hypothetical protein